MSDQGSAYSSGRWHRPRLYSAIVAMYLLAMSAGAAMYLAQYLWIDFHKDPDAVIIGPGPEFYILPPLGLMAISALAAIVLITDMEGPFVRLFEWAVLIVWSFVTVGVIFGALVSAGEADMRGFGIEDFFPQYLLAYALAGVNGVMYFFLHEGHSRRFSYDLKLKSAVVVISIVSIGGFVILAITYIVLLLNPGLSYSLTGHLPDSFLLRPVSDSPEGKAFLARYPGSEIHVFQLFDHPDCCEVTLSYLRNSTETCISNEVEYWCGPQGPSATLRTRVVLSDDLKTIAVTRISLFCSAEARDGQPGHWTVKGDIVESLRPENLHCWDVGPSSRPSDAELIEIAKSTTVGKAYLAKYPDNTISVKLDNTPSNEPEVTFTRTTSEPIQFGVSFAGLDWDVSQIWIVCSNGDQTWYLYADEPDFWTHFQPQQGNCWDYPPSE